jgi:gluconate 2-dehydrogenase gamma chain
MSTLNLMAASISEPATVSDHASDAGITRREALTRAAALLGGLVFAPAFTGILSGCSARPGAWKSVLFDKQQQAALIALVDTILPATDTPSASEAGVPAFIEELLSRNVSEEQRLRFMEGLRSFMEASEASLGSPFGKAEAQSRHDHVLDLLREAADGGGNGGAQDDGGPAFISVAKELTVVGYFTSEAGATQVLRYAPIPGPYQGCIPFEQVGRTWAT